MINQSEVPQREYLGIDGCRQGWLAIGLKEDGQWWAEIWTNLESLASRMDKLGQVLIDVPIGLPDGERRACDGLARRLLQQRRSSVFSVPARTALQATDYRSACDRNQALLGVRIAKQAWNIGPKILEADRWIQKYDPQQKLVYESHPELAFYGLAGRVPMAHPKKSSAGIEERLALLGEQWPPATDVYSQLMERYLRREVASDDILDALVLAMTAAWAPSLRHLPDQPDRDRQGLRREIVFGEWNNTPNA